MRRKMANWQHWRSCKRPLLTKLVKLSRLSSTAMSMCKTHHPKKDPKVDVVFQAQIMAIAGAIKYTWQEASFLVAKSQGHGNYWACSIQTWIHKYLTSGKLPLHFSGHYHSSILEDEDIAQSIQLHLVEVAKDEYICAQDIVDYIATDKMQDMLGSKKRGICLRTPQQWLQKLDWQYGRKKKECILMAMNRMMLSSTKVNLFSDGKGMRSGW